MALIDNADKIAVLQTILESGAAAVNVDGMSATYRRRDDIVAEIERLKAEDTVNGYTRRRKLKSINLGGF